MFQQPPETDVDLRPFGYAPGWYTFRCRGCFTKEAVAAKYSSQCFDCAMSDYKKHCKKLDFEQTNNLTAPISEENRRSMMRSLIQLKQAEYDMLVLDDKDYDALVVWSLLQAIQQTENLAQKALSVANIIR